MSRTKVTGSQVTGVTESDLALADNTVADVSTSQHGFAPKAPGNVNYVLRGNATWGQVAEAGLALTDITTNDVSITAHGFAPKAPNDTTKFLRGDGTWNTPSVPGVPLSVAAGSTLTVSANTQMLYHVPIQIDGIVHIDGALVELTNSTPSEVIASTQQTGSTYTFVFSDGGTVVEGDSASAQTFTIPPHSAVPYAIGTVIEVYQYGAGAITIAAGSGVTLKSDGGKVSTAAQNATIGLRQRALDDWVLTGDLA